MSFIYSVSTLVSLCNISGSSVCVVFAIIYFIYFLLPEKGVTSIPVARMVPSFTAVNLAESWFDSGQSCRVIHASITSMC